MRRLMVLGPLAGAAVAVAGDRLLEGVVLEILLTDPSTSSGPLLRLEWDRVLRLQSVMSTSGDPVNYIGVVTLLIVIVSIASIVPAQRDERIRAGCSMGWRIRRDDCYHA